MKKSLLALLVFVSASTLSANTTEISQDVLTVATTQENKDKKEIQVVETEKEVLTVETEKAN